MPLQLCSSEPSDRLPIWDHDPAQASGPMRPTVAWKCDIGWKKSGTSCVAPSGAGQYIDGSGAEALIVMVKTRDCKQMIHGRIGQQVGN